MPGRPRARGVWYDDVVTLPAPVRSALDEFCRTTRTRYGDRILELRLYGSWARGDPHEYSDVDVLVLLDGATPAEVRDLVELGVEIFGRTGVDIAPLVWTPEKHATWRAHERRLVLDIEREGIAL